MELKRRLQTAFKEDANVVGLASAAALSLALLNPLPLLIGFVAEVAYLLYVPDSRWYENRLSRRFDEEILVRRRKLQSELFPVLPEHLQSQFLRMDAQRETLLTVVVESSDERRWFEYIRQIDYLLEILLQLAAKQMKFPLHFALPHDTEPDKWEHELPALDDHHRLLEHFESETAALSQLVTVQEDEHRQAVLSRGVRELERETDTLRKELWQMATAQELFANLRQTIQETEQLLQSTYKQVPNENGTVESFYNRARQQVQEAERLSRHQNNWLKQTATSVAHRN